MQSSKLLVASLSCAELGTAQPQLVFISVFTTSCISFFNGGPIISSWSIIVDDSGDCLSITSFLDGESTMPSFFRGFFTSGLG